tara:strand:- start:31 stop:534 length:504 start_codon:yes stop_codon:yes gene_type:complete
MSEYTKQYNGRINIMGPNTGDVFQLYDRIPVDKKTTGYDNAMTGNWTATTLSKAYFSSENINIIQNAIKAGVYHTSKGTFVIGNQDLDTLKIIMRSTFLQFSSNTHQNITSQISNLNQLVVDYAVPQIIGEAEGYVKYKNDVSTLAVPMKRPMSTYHTNTLKQKDWF